MITKLRELTTMPTSVPVPFSEPPYLTGLPSAYYKETHFKWQKTCRAFAEETMMPYAAEWERNGDVPGRAHVYTSTSQHPNSVQRISTPNL
jgi:acyl-CoA dehydrogenase